MNFRADINGLRALAVLAAAMLAAGIAWLLPQDLLSLGKQVATAVTFVSNLLFWRESGYFAPQAQTSACSIRFPLCARTRAAGGRTVTGRCSATPTI